MGLGTILLVISLIIQQSVETPLDDYVHKDDGYFSWRLIGSYPGPGYNSYVLNMTSQKWKDESVSNQPEWWHYVVITVPEMVVYKSEAFVMVDNGNMDDAVPTPGTDSRINNTIEWAMGMGAVAADIKMIPNQYLQMAGDPPDRRRREDDLIAWTWRRFIDDPSDPEIVLQLPMTKSAVRALDAIEQFVPTVAPPGVFPTRFVMAGGSKRGWTTYLATSVDRRIFAMAPSVLTCLNFVENVHHQYRSLGGWSFAQIDYYNENLTQQIDHPNFQLMLDFIDPYIYRDRLNLPKLIIAGVGDEHFLLDDSHYFWDDLRGDSYLWMLENSGHSLGYRPNRTENYITFFKATAEGLRLPRLTWQRNETDTEGIITLWAEDDYLPHYIAIIWGTTLQPETRDFRAHILDQETGNTVEQTITWNEDPVTELSAGIYEARFPKPTSGWLAFYIKAQFTVPNGGGQFYTTTEVNVIPDVLPFARCQGDTCRGSLV